MKNALRDAEKNMENLYRVAKRVGFFDRLIRTDKAILMGNKIFESLTQCSLLCQIAHQAGYPTDDLNRIVNKVTLLYKRRWGWHRKMVLASVKA